MNFKSGLKCGTLNTFRVSLEGNADSEYSEYFQPLEGYTLLHCAVGLCNVDKLNTLLERNADPNIRSADLLTPVQLCAYWDFDIPLRLLLMAGGDPYLCDSSGRNTFEIASELESMKCISVLEDFITDHKQNPRFTHVLGTEGLFIRSGNAHPDTKKDVYFCNHNYDPKMLNQDFKLRNLDNIVQYNLLSEENINGLCVTKYLYDDCGAKVAFLETRYPGSTSVSSCSTSASGSNMGFLQQNNPASHDQCPLTEVPTSIQKQDGNSTIARRDNPSYSVGTESEHSNPLFYSKLSNSEIFDKLKGFGVSVGPVTGTTRNLYLKMLILVTSSTKTKDEHVEDKMLGLVITPNCKGKCSSAVRDSSSQYSQLLQAFLVIPATDWQEKFISMEWELRCDFDRPGIKWREGRHKTAFNYLLLDSRLTQNLPNRPLSPHQQMEIFLQAIFYVGKGTRARPLFHLYEAASAYNLKRSTVCEKVQKICEIWRSGYGVVNLYCFQNVIPVEAFTREACMISALGLNNLTNIRRGDFYGAARQWPVQKKRIFGVFLLFRAFHLLINDGERQIKLADINIR